MHGGLVSLVVLWPGKREDGFGPWCSTPASYAKGTPGPDEN